MTATGNIALTFAYAILAREYTFAWETVGSSGHVAMHLIDEAFTFSTGGLVADVAMLLHLEGVPLAPLYGTRFEDCVQFAAWLRIN